MKHETSPDSRSQNASAVDALQEARAMPPGGQRTDALKKVCLLRHVADSHELIVMKKGRPRVVGVKANCHYLGSTPPLLYPRSRTLDRTLSLIAAFIIVAIIMVARY